MSLNTLAAKEMQPNLGGIVPDGPAQKFYVSDLMRRLAIRVNNQIEYDRVNKAPKFRLTLASLERATCLQERTIRHALSGGVVTAATMDKMMHALGLNVYDLLDIPKLKEIGTKVKRSGLGKIIALVPAEQSIDKSIRSLLEIADGIEDWLLKKRITDIATELSQQLHWDKELKPHDVEQRVNRVFTKSKPKPRHRPWKNTPAVVTNYMAEYGVTRDYVRSLILHEIQVYENTPDIASSVDAHIRFKLGCSPSQADRAIGWATRRETT